MTPCHSTNVQNSARNISLLYKNPRALSDLELKPVFTCSENSHKNLLIIMV